MLLETVVAEVPVLLETVALLASDRPPEAESPSLLSVSSQRMGAAIFAAKELAADLLAADLPRPPEVERTLAEWADSLLSWWHAEFPHHHPHHPLGRLHEDEAPVEAGKLKSFH